MKRTIPLLLLAAAPAVASADGWVYSVPDGNQWWDQGILEPQGVCPLNTPDVSVPSAWDDISRCAKNAATARSRMASHGMARYHRLRRRRMIPLAAKTANSRSRPTAESWSGRMAVAILLPRNRTRKSPPSA